MQKMIEKEAKEEIWKDIVGYEGLYQVSNLGNVKSLDRKRFNGRVMANKKGEVIKQNISKRGYCFLPLSKEGVRKNMLVHRLVAIAFLPNPDNLPQVNHKDEDKQNNSLYNLEWCDAQYNNNYGTACERHSKSKKENPPNIIEYEFNGEIHCLKEWAKIKCIGYDKIKKRWKKGLRGDDLFAIEDYSKVYYDFLGKNYTLTEWSAHVEMKYQLLYSRWKRGKRGYELFKGYEHKLPR